MHLRREIREIPAGPRACRQARCRAEFSPAGPADIPGSFGIDCCTRMTRGNRSAHVGGACPDAKEVWVRGNPRVRTTEEQEGTALEPKALREAPTATDSGIPLRSADFATLAEALDYAATGDSGFNFYDGRGGMTASLTYSELRARALELAKRGAPLRSGQRLALVADTHPDFAVML